MHQRFFIPCVLLCLLFLPAMHSSADTPVMLGNHRARFDSNGLLLPWTSWRDALQREVNWYAHCPMEHGYPRFVTLTFMDGTYAPVKRRTDMIPAMQLGMGILSYLKYYHFTHRRYAPARTIAIAMGSYLIHEDLTPDTGKYPRFIRSTGRTMQFPQTPDCGSQADHPYEIEPDKAGIAAYALVRLYEETDNADYLNAALHNARVLVRNMQQGDGTHSPWPFRADYRTGAARGPVCADQSFTLRLFNLLDSRGYHEFRAPADALWHWIKTYQIPSAARRGTLWTQFFEDYDMEKNRNSWSADNLIKYLLQKRRALDPDWRKDTAVLVRFVTANFTSIRNGVPICGEQDDDREPWGGACSTYGATMAMYAAATGSKPYKLLAREALNFCMYAISRDGCPGQTALYTVRGGWQEDASTDVIHNFMDAIAAFPRWGR